MGFSKYETCKICGEKHCYQTGFFTKHLKKDHNMSLRIYVILFQYSGLPPKCECGLCNKQPHFSRGKFKKYALGHGKYTKRKELYIKKYGIPECLKCGNKIKKWYRERPNKYCDNCHPDCWNQEKIKNTVRKKYGVDNVSQLDWVKKKIVENNDYDEIIRKGRITKQERYENGAFDSDVMKTTLLDKYGVDNTFKLPKVIKASKKRMKENNPMFNEEISRKATKTLIENIASGKTKLYNTKKYKNTNLYYQSSYEEEFLNLCEELNILDKIENGNSYKTDDSFILTDFTFGDYEIEIKSSWILEKQGGEEILNKKKNTVENTGRTYILILDKDYSNFLSILK